MGFRKTSRRSIVSGLLSAEFQITFSSQTDLGCIFYYLKHVCHTQRPKNVENEKQQRQQQMLINLPSLL